MNEIEELAIAAPLSSSSAAVNRLRRPGAYVSSELRIATYSPVARISPVLIVRCAPWFGWVQKTTRSSCSASPRTMAAESSVDPSSMTIISFTTLP